MSDASGLNPTTRRPASTSKRLWIALAALVTLLLLAVVLPSLLSVNRYRRTITAAMARSLGRPVHLSGVDWRLLPTPAFILHDLTVSEDPSFGAEPLLTARTVVASVDLFSLWRGRPVFSSIHVDQASLNLVRNPAGRWNLDALVGGPAHQQLASSATPKPHHALPYLEATESRLNLKFGDEKSPYSLVNSDLSFWQDQPGQWRIRLRGQPLRTDIAQSGDTGQDSGEIRVEGSLQTAASLRQMPVHLQLAWRNAQLGQLSLLLLGDDAGWRGNLTADLSLNGTAERAAIQGRLSATGVHRAELGPVAPLDFDSNCGLIYQHSTQAIHQLHCDTRIGDGHLLYAADLPAASEHQPASQSVILQAVPLQATLDLLRTMRSHFAPGLTATGTLDGELRFQPPTPAPLHSTRRRPSALPPVVSPVWTGSISLTGGELRGLSQPWRLDHVTLQPDGSGMLTTTIPLPVCAARKSSPATSVADSKTSSNCAAALSLTHAGYQVHLTGTASLPRLSSFVRALGIALPSLDGFQSGTAEMRLQATGPWIRSLNLPAASDPLTGSLHFHAARWNQSSLPLPVILPDAMLTLDAGSFVLRGTATNGPLHAQFVLTQPLPATDPDSITAAALSATASPALPSPIPSLTLGFDHLDAAGLETALAPADKQSGLFASIANRVHPEALPALPPMRLTLTAATCSLAHLNLVRCSATLHRDPADPARAFALDGFRAALGNGTLAATGTIDQTEAGQRFRLHLVAENLQPAPLATLIDEHWTGGSLAATADLATHGTAAAQWIAAATGTLHFDWKHGNLGDAVAQPAAHPAIAHSAAQAADTPAGAFDRWTGTATWANGRLTLGTNTLTRHGRESTLTGAIPGPPRLTVLHP